VREIVRHYGEDFDEERRLADGVGALEFARTCEIVSRHLPAGPAIVLDVGGGPGAYSLWLASEGHTVHLLDLVPRHVERARERGVASSTVADARALPSGAASFDVVLLLGPLYHLPERADRVAALREALRVLRGGGIVFAAAISRFASLLDGLARGRWDDETFAPIIEEDLRTGRHLNPTGNPEFFTTAFFHRPEELGGELTEAGFIEVETLPVEGPAWIARDLEGRWKQERKRKELLALVRRVEREESLFCLSPHLLAVGRKP
jgi:SAM-dependent methyltransferase